MEDANNTELLKLREKLRKQRLEKALDTLGIRSKTEDDIVDLVNQQIGSALENGRIGAVVEGVKYVIPFVGNLQQIALMSIVEQYKPYRKESKSNLELE